MEGGAGEPARLARDAALQTVRKSLIVGEVTFAVNNTYNSSSTGGFRTFLAESANVAVTDVEVFAV